jgi:hypothetical protein
MKDQNLIHIRLSHSEAVNSKKDILSTQMNLIKMLKVMKSFHKLRSEELKTKAQIQKKLKELDSDIHKLELLLPKIKIPKILQTGTEEIKEEVKETVKKKEKDPHEKDLEQQLLEIQEKLKKLE